MEGLKLTDAERLILANQYSTLSRLESLQNGSSVDWYAELAENLRKGHSFLYDEKLYISPVLDEATKNHVLDTLDMFGALETSYRDFNVEEKAGINERNITFEGFDFNNETEMYSFATALAEEGRFSPVLTKDRYLNSHSPTYEVYGRMIREWKAMGKPYLMNSAQVSQIAAARVHPAYR